MLSIRFTGKTEVEAEFRSDVFYPGQKPGKDALKSTLKAPERNDSIPETAQWLSGEGAGSWFVFEPRDSILGVKPDSNLEMNPDSNLEVTRYSPGGDVECHGIFSISAQGDIIPDNSWEITYPSNCKVVTLKNGVSEIKYLRLVD